ncbi:MAG: hypothetical protein ABI606_10750 [Rhodoferax sp.]
MKTLFLLLGLTVWAAHSAQAQSFCASDGQATPVALVERFISADCEACWSEPQTNKTAPRTLTLDWIVPGKQGEDAPLSAAASQDALVRLQTLRRAAPTTSTRTNSPVLEGRANQLRVAHGLPLGGYIGTSIELKTALHPRGQATLSAWLVLVETIPAGADGTSTPRNLIRNVLQLPWNKRNQLLKTEQTIFHETRPLSIPSGATPERLRVVGWVQDGRGRILTAAQSVCAPT